MKLLSQGDRQRRVPGPVGDSIETHDVTISAGRAIRRIAALLFALCFAVPAYAHDDTGLAGGVAMGFAHPLSGLDHALAMISVGIWGAFLGRPLVFVLPMLFPAAMAVGGGLGIAGVPFPPVELGIALSVVTLGLLIAFAVRAPVAVACAVVGVFALFHGYAHGEELPSAADPIGYSLGFVISTGLLHLAGIGLGLARGLRSGAVALRFAGAAVTLAGLWFVAEGIGR